MSMCKEVAIKFKKIDDGVMDRIKEMLSESLDTNFKKTEKGLKPPVIVLTFDPDGQISVVTSEKEFNIRESGPELFKLIPQFTSMIPTTIFTGRGSGIAGVNIGGESLTDIWPW